MDTLFSNLKKRNYSDDVDTNESSYNNNYSNKKSNFLNHSENKSGLIDFPKKKYLEELSNEEYMDLEFSLRKYSEQPSLNIKDFVPHPKPLKMHFIPSKLKLNEKGFKDLKRNQINNQILIKTKNYYISCPSSDNDSSDQPNDNEMKDLRKKMKKLKSNIPKVLSKEIINNNSLEKEITFDDSFIDNNDINDDGVNIELYDDDINELKYSEEPWLNNQNMENINNSCSILQLLKGEN